MRRLGYMEKLLAHYVGDENMDTENLRSLVEATVKDTEMTQVDQIDKIEQTDSPVSEILDDDDENVDENFTVQNLGNNITRRFTSFHWAISYAFPLLT